MNDFHNIRGGFHYAMHGGGAYKGLIHTNTKEALEYWYTRGIRIFEMDVARADDREWVVMAHHVAEADMLRHEVINKPKDDKYTSTWFLSQKLFKYSTRGLSSMTLDDLLDWLNRDPSIMIILDYFGGREDVADLACCIKKMWVLILVY